MTHAVRSTVGCMSVHLAEVALPLFEPHLYPRLRESLQHSQGANLRFKSTELSNIARFARR